MIAKFDGISGDNLAALLTFIHGDGNRVTISGEAIQPMVVRVKAVTPDNQGGGTWYGLTLDIVEWLPKGDEPGQDRVDPEYFLTVYKILGRKQLTECAPVEREQVEAKKELPIPAGAKVRTTQINTEFQSLWAEKDRAKRKWDVEGTVIFSYNLPLRGQCYKIRHQDGTETLYLHVELEVVS